MRIATLLRRAGICLAIHLGIIASSEAQTFQAGDIFVTQFSGNKVQRYSSSGTLLQTFTDSGSNWLGVALTPDGKLVASYRSPANTVDVFSPSGSLLSSFPVGTGSLFDVAVFANGTIAANIAGPSVVRLFNQSGTLLNTVTLTGISGPWGMTVGTDDILYVTDTFGKIGKVNSSGTFLGSFATASNVTDLVMSPLDGTLWVTTSAGQIYNYTTSGAQIGASFSTGLSGYADGIGIAPDGLSLYVTTETSGVIRRLSLTGTVLNDIPMTGSNIPFFMTVATVPEPATAWLLGGTGMCLLLRRRRGA